MAYAGKRDRDTGHSWADSLNRRQGAGRLGIPTQLHSPGYFAMNIHPRSVGLNPSRFTCPSTRFHFWKTVYPFMQRTSFVPEYP